MFTPILDYKYHEFEGVSLVDGNNKVPRGQVWYAISQIYIHLPHLIYN